MRLLPKLRAELWVRQREPASRSRRDAAGQRLSSEGRCEVCSAQSQAPQPCISFIYLSQETKDQHLHTALFLHDSIGFVYCSDYFGLLLSLKSVPFI